MLRLDEIDRQIELYRQRGADERREIVGLQPKRAEVILAGACIVRTVMGKLGSTTVTVSDRGFRHSLVVERFAIPETPDLRQAERVTGGGLVEFVLHLHE